MQNFFQTIWMLYCIQFQMGQMNGNHDSFIKYQLMDIGSSVAIFVVLSLILLALFCLLTRYFHHKLTQNLEEAAQIYSVVDQLGNQNQNDMQGNYQQFKEHQKENKLRAQNKQKPGYEEIEMANMKTPLNQDDDIYSPNILRRRLNNETNALKMQNIKMESNRSMSFLKQFKPEKLITTNRTGRSHHEAADTKRSFQKSGFINGQDDLTKHTYVNKLVCYDSQGITVIQVNVTSIRKVGEGAFKEAKNVRTWVVSVNQSNFDDQLQIYGFQQSDFSCYKYSTKVEINSMKYNQDYAIKSLKTCEIKQAIEIEDYLRMKMQLQMNI